MTTYHIEFPVELETINQDMSLQIRVKDLLDLHQEIDALKLATRWQPRSMITSHEMDGLFVRCKNGYITSGFYDGGTWWVYDKAKGECHPENPSDPITHWMKRPKDRPWMS